MTPRRGEVWLLDLGMVEKVRPALIVSTSYGDLDRALITIVPHTTSLRGSEFEITIPVSFLKTGAFLVQNVATYPVVRAVRKLARDCFDGSATSYFPAQNSPFDGTTARSRSRLGHKTHAVNSTFLRHDL